MKKERLAAVWESPNKFTRELESDLLRRNEKWPQRTEKQGLERQKHRYISSKFGQKPGISSE